MAEAVVSVALETFRDLLLEEVRFLSGVRDKVKALQTQLKEMKCLLKDADGKQHEHESVRNWIAEIRDLAYRAEDIIETYAIEVSSKRGRGLKNLLRRFSCIMKECYSLHQVGSEISKIKADLAGVSESMRSYGIRSIIEGESSRTTNDNQEWKRQTFPDFQNKDCFVGRKAELEDIVSRLVNDDQHRILSICGMGGLGKTTIAREAYNDARTKRYFQCFAWVCITQQCQITSVLEDVLKQLNPSKSSSLSNRELIKELCQIQKDKRCMVVLDDLWETDQWDDLEHAFLVKDLKSKILVTTRKQEVAKIGFPIQLGLLRMDSGLELLKRKASNSNIPGQWGHFTVQTIQTVALFRDTKSLHHFRRVRSAQLQMSPNHCFLEENSPIVKTRHQICPFSRNLRRVDGFWGFSRAVLLYLAIPEEVEDQWRGRRRPIQRCEANKICSEEEDEDDLEVVPYRARIN